MPVGIPTLRDTFGRARACCWVTCLKDSLPNMRPGPAPLFLAPPVPFSLHAALILLQLAVLTGTLVSGSTTLHTHAHSAPLESPPKTQTFILVGTVQVAPLHGGCAPLSVCCWGPLQSTQPMTGSSPAGLAPQLRSTCSQCEATLCHRHQAVLHGQEPP